MKAWAVGAVRDVVAFATLTVACAAIASCVLALSGADADRMRAIQVHTARVYADDAQTPVARQFARADYCLARAALLGNEQEPIDAGPGAACDPPRIEP